MACCYRAYNKLTSAALTWQTQEPSSDAHVTLKQAAANKALQGLQKLHTRVTGSTAHKQQGHGAVLPHAAVQQPVAPLPWLVEDINAS